MLTEHPERPQRGRHRFSPAIARRERAELDDVTCGGDVPPRASTVHPDLDERERLVCDLGASAADRKTGRAKLARGAARQAVDRDAIRDSLIQPERGRGGECPRSHDRAEAWLALVVGRWSIVDHFERDGRRYFVARRNAHSQAYSRTLSSREHAVAHLAASGRPNKFIAYSLGCSASTIATHLAAASKKLGVTSRLALVSLLTALRPTRDRPDAAEVLQQQSSLSSKASDTAVDVFEAKIGGTSYFVICLISGRLLADPLSPAEREIANDVLAGLTNVEIASKRARAVRTIANQLASIFRKLGVGSRFELTARLTSLWSPP